MSVRRRGWRSRWPISASLGRNTQTYFVVRSPIEPMFKHGLYYVGHPLRLVKTCHPNFLCHRQRGKRTADWIMTSVINRSVNVPPGGHIDAINNRFYTIPRSVRKWGVWVFYTPSLFVLAEKNFVEEKYRSVSVKRDWMFPTIWNFFRFISSNWKGQKSPFLTQIYVKMQ